MRDNPLVDAYLAEVPREQRHILERLRARIRSRLPEAEERFHSRMPAYQVNGEWAAGFAFRKTGPVFFIGKPELLDEYGPILGSSRSSETYIDMVETDRLSLASLESIADEILSRLGLGQASSAASSVD